MDVSVALANSSAGGAGVAARRIAAASKAIETAVPYGGGSARGVAFANIAVGKTCVLIRRADLRWLAAAGSRVAPLLGVTGIVDLYFGAENVAGFDALPIAASFAGRANEIPAGIPHANLVVLALLRLKRAIEAKPA